MTRSSELPESKVEGIWSPQQLAEVVGCSRQAIIHSINGRAKYPRRLFAQKVGQLWLIPDTHAEAYLHWYRTGELLEEPPIPEKLYWGTKEIADAVGIPLVQVERAVGGAVSIKGNYTYNYQATLRAVRFSKSWLVKPEDAQEYIREQIEKKGRD